MVFSNLARGTIISAIAAVLILVVLILLQLNGLRYAMNPLALALMYVLFFMAILAFYEYSKLEMPYYKVFLYSIPTGLAIVFAGLLMLALGVFEGVYLIVLGYLSEPIGGIAPFSYYMRINRTLGLLTYICGALYVLTLPLFILNLGILPIIFDAIKLAGFLAITNVIFMQRFKIEEMEIKKIR